MTRNHSISNIVKVLVLACTLLFIYPDSSNAQENNAKEEVIYYDLEFKHIVPSFRIPYSQTYGRTSVIDVRTNKLETYVTLAVPIHFKANWIALASNTILYDRRTGDIYKVRRENNGIPLDQVSVIKGFEQQVIEVTLVFPPLKRHVRRVDFMEMPGSESTCKIPDNGSKWIFYNLRVHRNSYAPLKGDIIR